MAKQVAKRRRRRRVVVVREKNMQNSQDRRNINLLQSSIYKQKSHKRHLKRLQAAKQQCGQFECQSILASLFIEQAHNTCALDQFQID